MPYLPILDVLKGYFGIEEEDREATIKKKMRNRLRELDKSVQAVPPTLHDVLSLKVEDDKYVQLSPHQRRERTFEAIRDLLIRESQRKTLVLAIEDLHWIDKTSEEFLDYLLGFLPTARILLILLYRPEYTHTWGSKSYYGKIGLDQLSAQTSAELVQAILEGGRVAPEIAGLVLGRAGGNPLFVEELTHSLVENGSIQKKDNHFVLTRKPSEIEVPDTIQGIIAARMDRIEDNLKRIMQVASVIGREFAYRILQSITDMSEDLKASLLNLQGLEFIYEKQLFPELEYIFKHALTQEVAYNSLLLKRRKEIHEKIGSAIEQLYSERLEEYYELLAYHYVRSENKEKAVEHLSLANRKAVRASAMEEAKSLFDQAMELLDSLPDKDENRETRVSLLADQVHVFNLLFLAQEYYDLLTHYEPMTANISKPGLVGSFYLGVGGCEHLFGYFDKSIQTLSKAARLCEEAGNSEDAGNAYMCLQWSHFYKGNFDQSLTFREHALRKMEEQFNLRTYMWALAGGCIAYASMGRFDDAIEECQKALNTAEEFSDNSAASFAAATISYAYLLKGDLERAIEYGEMAAQKAPTPMDKAVSQGYLAWAWCRAGEPSKGIEVLEPLVQVFRAGRFLPGEAGYSLLLGDCYLSAGEYNNADQTIRRGMELAERCGMNGNIGNAHGFLGEIALKTNPDEAAPHFEKAISIFKEIRAENALALAYSGMGRYHKQQGNTAQAREYLTKALEIFERLGTLIEPDKVREELADL